MSKLRKPYNITPVPKPRQTRRDKWAVRPSVARYRHFADQVRALGVRLPESGSSILFVLPMPKSWSKKKKEIWNYQPHQGRPDLSNLIKSLEDAIYQDDSGIWQYRGLEKRWGYEGKIIIQIEERG